MKLGEPFRQSPAPNLGNATFYNRIKHRCRNQLNISKFLACFAPFVVSETVVDHSRPVKSGTPEHPLHLMGRLMSTTQTIMHLSHGNPSLVTGQTFQEKAISRSAIQVIINVYLRAKRRTALFVLRLGFCKYAMMGSLQSDTSLLSAFPP